MARKPKTVAERNNQKPQAGNRKVRRGHLAAKRAQKANPEELPERPDNSLFGKKRAKEATAEEGGGWDGTASARQHHNGEADCKRDGYFLVAEFRGATIRRVERHAAAVHSGAER